MEFEANQSYNVRVRFASAVESNSGTPGIQIGFYKDDGEEIQHTLWVTPKTIEFVARDLEKLDVDASQLSSPTFMDNIGTILANRVCSVTTSLETYKDKSTIKVKYINRVGSGIAPGHRIAEMFGGPKASVPAAPPPPPMEAPEPVPDDDLPF